MKEKRIPFSNTYMFGRVMRDEAICQGFIETVLGVRVERITYTNAEQVLEPVPDGKGVRLDLYVESDGGAFDLEMQSYGEKALGRRFRYYQSAIDARCLDKGDDYDMLPEAYVVFLCTHDPFGLGLPTYRLERECMEDRTCNVACGSHWLALNSSAYGSLPSGRLRHLLEYVEMGTVGTDELVERIARAVDKANDDAKWVKKVFSVSTVEENAERRVRIAEREARRNALAEGREEGIEQANLLYSTLIERLFADGRVDDVRRAAGDPAYRNSLMSELGIE